MSEFIKTGNDAAKIRLILAHGAGAAMDSPFMTYFADRLGDEDLQVVRFEFPYMQIRRQDGGRRPPDRQPKLLTHWQQVIAALGPVQNLVIGGKSMGGRMASMIADEAQVKGLVCLGYPFYAPGRQDKPRTDHLGALKTKTLIVQGERDSMGDTETVGAYALSSAISMHWCPDGDHSFKPRKASGVTEIENWDAAIKVVRAFVCALD